MHETERKSYHACALALQGEFEALQRLRERASSWEAALGKLERGVDRERAWQSLSQHGIELILREDAGYPALLKEIPLAPFGIYLRGGPLSESSLSIGVVGTRKATPQGKTAAMRFGKQLGQRGVVIVSGLALGIDAAAHRGALEGSGKTVAVLAHGLDQIYPRQHETLGKEILESGGMLVSEYPPGVTPLPHRFLARNRIVSGLSSGVIIIEAPERSGSLATARFALEQNRDVFAVPGSITHPNYAGSHELIKSGAALVTEVSDIVNAYQLPDTDEVVRGLTNAKEERVVAVIKANGSATVNAIAGETSYPIAELNELLAYLVIREVVKESNGTYTISNL